MYSTFEIHYSESVTSHLLAFGRETNARVPLDTKKWSLAAGVDNNAGGMESGEDINPGRMEISKEGRAGLDYNAGGMKFSLECTSRAGLDYKAGGMEYFP